ncbi:D-isomer specific 2-hydroxyacid dehydrogenase family protein [Pleurocapsa sp. PCC 7319]|uniref:NAD(P)-dependent oxidoreductase n=1 Tax=Pleurocapsa sp. PCC 7319 TaxID=118161 RepID=UPI00034C889A|nr:NAD(P)-dependent oxidoreductase [Pleurocapsa sp. PCC 7319]
MAKISVFSCEHELITRKFVELTAPYSGHYIYVNPPKSNKEKRSRIADMDTVIQFFNATPICASSLKGINPPQRIVVAGPVGKSVDIKAAKYLKIPVFDTPGLAVDSVAEFTLFQILSLCHQYDQNVLPLRNGEWPCIFRQDFAECTLGIIGFGRIGRKVALLAKAFKVKKILVWSPSLSKFSKLPEKISFAELDLLLSESDIVCLHLRLNKNTHEILNSSRLSLLKKDAFLINAARAELVDMSYLRSMISGNRISKVALDVFQLEPLDKNDILRSSDRVMPTAHTAWRSEKSVSKFIQAAVDFVFENLSDKVRQVV